MNSNDCGQVDDYLDGELAAGAIGAFEVHLATCASCRRAAAESAAVTGLLKRAFAVEQAASLLPTMKESIEAEPLSNGTSRRSWQLRLRRAGRRAGGNVAWAACVAAVMLICLTALLYFDDNSIESHRRNRLTRPSPIDHPIAISPELASVDATTEVQLAENQKLLAVRMPTQHKNVTIVWMYPTIR
jgi:anti-sigma factor RsiW